MTGEPARKEYAQTIEASLAAAYPTAGCALEHRTPYQLLVATILSAQCTDARVNMVTPALFARYPDPPALAAADLAELEDIIRSTGFFRAKARSLTGMARAVVEGYSGRIPADMESLTRLPGVGRKTANVLLGTAFGTAVGVVVDTHVARLSRRLGLTRHTDPERIEQDLMALFPHESWILLSHRLIHHGRRVCQARKPACETCPLDGLCPRNGVGGAGGPAGAPAPRARRSRTARKEL